MDLIRNDLASRVLEKSLDGLSLRAQTISNNVANVDTPNFKASEVSFEQQLLSAIGGQPAAGDLPLAVTNAAHIDPNHAASLDEIKPAAVQLTNTTLRNDGNNVDVDREMARLAETQLAYQASTQLLNEKLRLFKEAVWEGKK
jgi:flagellar basal-body rod protein FlgB